MLDDIIKFIFMIMIAPIAACIWFSCITELHKRWKEWNDGHFHR